MDGEEFRRRGKEMIDFVVDYLEEKIKNYRPFPKVEPGYLTKFIPRDAPTDPESFDDVMKDFHEAIMPGVTHWQSPHFHAYFQASSSYPAICADILSDALNCVAFAWVASPAHTELETAMMDWLVRLLDLPECFMFGGKGGGIIEGTASEANLMALLAARSKALAHGRETGERSAGEIIGKLVAYYSDQAHSSAERACLIGAVRGHQITSDDSDEMRGEDLKAAIEEDRAKGLIPFFVLATLGTTSCCSFDHLNEIGPVCEEESIWLHVDAAYAGAAFICPEFRSYLNGIEFADSFIFNPHKLLLTTFDCSALFYKDVSYILKEFNVDPIFRSQKHQFPIPDYGHWQIPFGRRFRALKLWFVIRMYGVSGLRQHIRKHVSLAKYFEELMKSDSRFVITHKVTLGLVCFRLKDKGNDVNAELLERINNDGRIYMIPSSSKGKYYLRFVIGSTLTERSDVQYAWNAIKEFATELLENNKNIN